MEGERGSKNINMVSELAKCPSHSKGMLHTYLGGLEKKKKKKQPLREGECWKSHIGWTRSN